MSGAHEHHHHHSDHDHDHGPVNFNRAFAIGIALNLSFVAIEIVFGILSDSLALVADAGHNLSDVLSLLLAWGAAILAAKAPSPRRTYGFRRVTILASFGSGAMLLVALGVILWEAIGRISHPVPVSGGTMMAVAAVGFVINSVTAALFMRGRAHDLNIKGAFLHMAADAAVSLGVVVSGAIIYFTGWPLVDPILSVLIVIVILVGTFSLMRESFSLLIDTVPERVDPAAVDQYLRSLPGVTEIHDLHIWAMSTTELALTAHVETCRPQVDNELLHRMEHELLEQFGISHVTVQVELDDHIRCRQADPDSV